MRPVSREGALVLVATPIGNLGDLSPRARAELDGADCIACEDTRRARWLLDQLGSAVPPLLVVNDHTEPARVPEVLARVRRGERVVVISDAGMPAVSDPGQALVQAARAEALAVQVVPGPSAVLAALVTSGLAPGRFAFEGFLPRKGSARSTRLAELADERRTVVAFEAPHRLVRTLADLAAALGAERPVVVTRELTKVHEEVWTGTLGDAVAHWSATEPRGEFALVVAGAPPAAEPDDARVHDAARAALAGGASRRDAADEVAATLGIGRKRAYAAVNEVAAR
jgi:16S rRNA (cytidine1402-2'-O)-methyltransferase